MGRVWEGFWTGWSHWPERGWPGGSRAALRRPTVGGAACWIPNQSLGQISVKPKMLSFKSLGLDLRITPSLSLPRATHIPPGRRKKASTSNVGPLKLDFVVFQKILQISLRKNYEKNKKIEVFGLRKPSQNLPKMPPKTMSQQTCDLSLILVRFWMLVTKADP